MATGLLAAALVLSGLARGTAPQSPPANLPSTLQTAAYDPEALAGPDAPTAFAHARAMGATAVRISVFWANIAPQQPSPANVSNPGNPTYDWNPVDRQVKLAVRNHLEPILDVFYAPAWAIDPKADPSLQVLRDPSDVARFMKAAARRYSGTFQGLPRVRYWQVWNEPNVRDYLWPQYQNGKPSSPQIYRQMVNASADAIHAVHRDNIVVAGSLSPFALGNAETNPHEGPVAVAPLRFLRELLCMSAGANPRPTCDDTVRFDAWAHHPYTAGGPRHHAIRPDNVSLGDLPEMARLLRAAEKAHHVQSAGPVRFWVTEFSWDSNPPDPGGVPVNLEASWVSEALYQAWKAGVSLFTWFRIRDQSSGLPFQSSLYQLGPTIAQDKPKPALAAFRFPFVGHPVKGRNQIVVWGRTPWSRPGKVLVERSSGGGWARLGVLTANGGGIFTGTFKSPGTGHVRARELRKGGLSALPFPLAPLPDLQVQPFGTTN